MSWSFSGKSISIFKHSQQLCLDRRFAMSKLKTFKKFSETDEHMHKRSTENHLFSTKHDKDEQLFINQIVFKKINLCLSINLHS